MVNDFERCASLLHAVLQRVLDAAPSSADEALAAARAAWAADGHSTQAVALTRQLARAQVEGSAAACSSALDAAAFAQFQPSLPKTTRRRTLCAPTALRATPSATTSARSLSSPKRWPLHRLAHERGARRLPIARPLSRTLGNGAPRSATSTTRLPRRLVGVALIAVLCCERYLTAGRFAPCRRKFAAQVVAAARAGGSRPGRLAPRKRRRAEQ